ncbi:hypothetical protein ACFL0H_03145 [Thermodesulfobacteriota bacterium]
MNFISRRMKWKKESSRFLQLPKATRQARRESLELTRDRESIDRTCRRVQVVPLMAEGLTTSLRRITYMSQSSFLPHTTAGSSMRRLASNTLLVPRGEPKSVVIITM